MSCSNGRFQVISDSATGAIISIVEIKDVSGAYLDPQNVITPTSGASSDGDAYADVLAALTECFVDDLEVSEDYICVSGVAAAGDLVPSETYKLVKKCDQNNVIRVMNVFASDGITVQYAETFDGEGNSLSVEGALPAEYTLGACKVNLLSTCATI